MYNVEWCQFVMLSNFIFHVYFLEKIDSLNLILEWILVKNKRHFSYHLDSFPFYCMSKFLVYFSKLFHNIHALFLSLHDFVYSVCIHSITYFKGYLVPKHQAFITHTFHRKLNGAISESAERWSKVVRKLIHAEETVARVNESGG